MVSHAMAVIGRSEESPPPQVKETKMQNNDTLTQQTDDAPQGREIRVSEDERFISKFNHI